MGRQRVKLAEQGKLIQAMVQPVGSAVVEKSQHLGMAVAVCGDAPAQFDALVVHADDHRAPWFMLEFQQQRGGTAEKEMHRDRCCRGDGQPGQDHLRIEMLQITGCPAQQNQQEGDQSPAHQNVP